MPLEVELKARVADLGAVRASLRALGARLLEERRFEDNLLLDDSSSRLGLRGEALRLRLLGDGAVLTWKSRTVPAEAVRGAAEGLKVRDEVETRCADGEALLSILGSLGLSTVFRYQKYRETWELDRVHVVLDETPAGDFLEIEGDAEDVRGAERRLGIRASDLVAESYPTLFRRILGERGQPAGQMVFRDRS